jgi:hypothetical protein
MTKGTKNQSRKKGNKKGKKKSKNITSTLKNIKDSKSQEKEDVKLQEMGYIQKEEREGLKPHEIENFKKQGLKVK